MKNVTILLFFLVPFLSIAQRNVQLTDLQVPNSPAFILLDVAPTSIDRPNSSKAFAASILNAINTNGGIPQNYAAEFAPFWFVKSKNMSARKYWGISDSDKLLPFSSIKLGTISFAFVNTSSTTNNFSIGGRTTLFKLLDDDNKKSLIDKNLAIVTLLRTITQNEIINGNADPAVIAKKVSEDPRISKAEKEIQDLLLVKPIFAIDGAIATNWVFDNSSFSTSRLGRFGAWLTLNYSQKFKDDLGNTTKNYINLYAVARYLEDHVLSQSNTIGDQKSLDYGGRLEIELDQLSISYELLGRSNRSDGPNTFRSSGLLRYRISDGVYLTSAFGQNFGNTLIAQFGISFGTGKEQVQAKSPE